MPKYLIQASYTAEGLKGLHKDKASGRREAVSHAVAALGGKLEEMLRVRRGRRDPDSGDARQRQHERTLAGGIGLGPRAEPAPRR